ncbi:hypothetical protein JOM56_009062 [Amanita muscaria]
MSLAEAEDLSQKLFASARDLTTIAGAVVANSARKLSCGCAQTPLTPPLASPPSQDTEDSLSGSLPPFPFTQILHEAGFHGMNLDKLVQLSLGSPHSTQVKAESLPNGVSSAYDHRCADYFPGADLSAYNRYPFMPTLVADDTLDHASFLSGTLRPITPDMGGSGTCDFTDTANLLSELVLYWDKIDFIYETAEAFLDTDTPMKAEKEHEMLREMVNMAILSLGALSCVLKLSDNMGSHANTAEILEYARSALRRIIVIDQFIDAAAEITLVDQSHLFEELKDLEQTKPKTM